MLQEEENGSTGLNLTVRLRNMRTKQGPLNLAVRDADFIRSNLKRREIRYQIVNG